MKVQILDGQPPALEKNYPTAEDLAKAQAIITGPTVVVCVLSVFALTVVLGVVGLGIGLLITVLVLAGNANVRRMSIQNAVEDRLEMERQR